MYRLQSIRKRYGSNVALDIEELTIAEGRLYTLTGANGAGKSTLLSILAFLVPPTSGEIYYAGKRVDRDHGSVEEYRRKVTLLHQSPYLFGGSVHDNVAFGLKVRGIQGEEQRRRIDEALDVVGLRGFRDRKARELSGGEAQRVAMARALALKPEVLLLDEPLANIDRETTGLLETVIASLPAQGTTVVMTTHDPDHPGRLNGESIFLEGGRHVLQSLR
ncbi:ABC transporter ATP-binding protein [Candidatus Deferrimicrobium sp.]|uniref:ABC transporter ATP-binding protein n=1 Tax=Candidatus Deferrimicrobium sp. TaxID=3060586 RepID=UPI002726B4B2|nr:ABC transporter ATP-binding protein [Candidatus Deferrimicrobium sp.]MDO8739861.1 ABC transporter ATP-binding protein [Candidatus Deferrimicrobium sp.]